MNFPGYRTLRRTIEKIEWSLRLPVMLEHYEKRPFNCQSARLETFEQIIAALRPAAIVETGTHLGNTTEYLARKCPNVISIEASKHLFAFSSIRLAHLANVSVIHGRSESVLKTADIGRLSEARTLFYLDAHSNHDAPLCEEIAAIDARFADAAIMIDDFRVDGEPQYGYASYRNGKALTLDNIQSALGGFVPFFPSVRGNDVSGWAILGKGPSADLLRSVKRLRLASP